MMEVVGTPVGRLLVATCGFPAAIFAWPAPDADGVAAGIAAFLAHWPRDTEAPQGRDPLPDFDRSGRVRRAAGPPAPCWLPRVPSAVAGCVLTQVCGALLQLFHARLVAHGGAAVDASDLVARYLTLPGRVALAPEAMTILLPMDRIEMPLRRAALDRDPGWLPWLQRTVRIEFEPFGPGELL
jgi:hypothetical protein